MAYSYTKLWTNPSDFPTVETNEARVRSDMQCLYDEALGFVNDLDSRVTSVASSSQKKAHHVILTAPAANWVKYSVTVGGATKYYHRTLFQVPMSSVPGTLAYDLAFASSVIVRVNPLNTNTAATEQAQREAVAERLVNADGVQFGLSRYVEHQGSGGVGVDYFTVVAYGWGNADAKDVVLDIFVFADTHDFAATAMPSVPVPN